MNPQIALIIPMFNSSAWLHETLASVQEQTMEAWECILVDDGSTDNTWTIAQDFVAKDKRFKVLHRPSSSPKGANACRNHGIANSSGSYLIFLDADDIITPDCFKKRLNAFEHHPNADALVFSTGTFSTMGQWGEVHNVDPKQESDLAYLSMFLSYKIPWQITNPIWKRSSLNTFDGFDEQLMRFQDVDFHTRALLSGLRVKRIKEVDFYYRIPVENSKYQDPKFMHKALGAMSSYIQRFGQDNSNTQWEAVMPLDKRRELLFEMLNKIVMQQLVPKRLWGWTPKFTKLAKQCNIISLQQANAIKRFVLFKRYNLDRIKGIGLYRVYSKTLKTSKLHKVE